MLVNGKESKRQPLPRVEVSILKAALLLAMLFSAGFALHTVAEVVDPAQRELASYVAIFTTCTIGLVFIHEGGHVIVGRAYGLRWTRLCIKFGVSIRLESCPGTVKSNYQQLGISLAGPILHSVAAGLLLWIALTHNYGVWDAVSVAAIVALADAVGNLFPTRRTDGGRATRAARRIVQGSGGEAFT